MNNEVPVKVENVSKKFCSRSFGNLKRSLWYGLKDIASEMTGLTLEHERMLCKDGTIRNQRYII